MFEWKFGGTCESVSIAVNGKCRTNGTIQDTVAKPVGEFTCASGNELNGALNEGTM